MHGKIRGYIPVSTHPFQADRLPLKTPRKSWKISGNILPQSVSTLLVKRVETKLALFASNEFDEFF